MLIVVLPCNFTNYCTKIKPKQTKTKEYYLSEHAVNVASSSSQMSRRSRNSLLAAVSRTGQRSANQVGSACSSLDLDVSAVTERSSPGVLDQPVWDTVFSSPSNSKN